MAGHKIPAEVIKKAAVQLIHGATIAEVSRTHKIARPTVVSIREGKHHSIPPDLRRKLVKDTLPKPVIRETKAKPKAGYLQLMTENIRMRKMLNDMKQQIELIMSGKVCA